MQQNKKGAIEMSLNLIIMLIIGLIVMGLIIAFVTSLINKSSDQFEDQLNDAQLRIKQQVENEAGYFAAGPDALEVKPGTKPSYLFVKVQNLGTSVLNIPSFEGALPTGVITMQSQIINSPQSCQLQVKGQGFDINPKDTQTMTLAILADSGTCTTGDELFLSLTFSPPGTELKKTEQIAISIE
ncbi:hypothetical protein H6501_00855 [Candidatus Woesearchaeota archaeon]|nr:hypothetical protein [Nanoarchaeota archaeon]MCB9370126.1 hypothetical protein [Candidatus Woesearchaeota archaeon]USN44656.1 MAG: hypothetical protein H6500_02330 [Candidatus Woesearchaeota archaeon]